MAAMTFTDLTTELSDRGFSYASATRLGRWVNVGYQEVCEQALWPFLSTAASGTAPLTVADLRTIESVEDTTNDRKLSPIDRRVLTDLYPDLPATGSPELYYLASSTSVGVYPANTSVALRVRYWKSPAVLSGTDVPVVPERYQLAIVDYAAARAYADNGDGDQALAARQEGDRTVAFMIESLIDPQADGASLWVPLDGVDC